MEYINTKKSSKGWAGLLLIWVILVIILMIVDITIGDFSFSASGLFFVIIVLFLPAILGLDIFLWNTLSKEIISTKNNQLKIRKTNRIFCKTKNIRFDQIKEIYLWNQNVWYIDLCYYLSFWDISRQGTICVKYKYKKYYFGRFLTEKEAQNLLNVLFQEIKKT